MSFRGTFDSKDVVVKRVLGDASASELKRLRDLDHKNVVKYLYHVILKCLHLKFVGTCAIYLIPGHR